MIDKEQWNTQVGWGRATAHPCNEKLTTKNIKRLVHSKMLVLSQVNWV
jgi:hypothetical protein